MTDDKTEEGAKLWRQAREAWADGSAAAPGDPDPLELAAYLDGRLDEAAATALEARLAAEPRLLDETMALRESLAMKPEAAPDAVIDRAQALRLQGPAPALSAAARPPRAGWLDRLFGGWLRPAVPAFAVLTLIVACAGAFELGRQQSEQMLLQQTAGTGEAELPDPLSLDIFI